MSKPAKCSKCKSTDIGEDITIGGWYCRTCGQQFEGAQTSLLAERGKTYNRSGSHEENFALAQTLQRAYSTATADRPHSVDYPMLMILAKVARIATGTDPLHDDTLADICGYAELAQRLPR